MYHKTHIIKYRDIFLKFGQSVCACWAALCKPCGGACHGLARRGVWVAYEGYDHYDPYDLDVFAHDPAYEDYDPCSYDPAEGRCLRWWRW